MSDNSYFFIYAIMFDQDTFGIFATRKEAEDDLKRQIASGGPAWEDCKIEQWRVNGTPEVVDGV